MPLNDIYYCDQCESRGPYPTSFCEGCGKSLCPGCHKPTEIDPWFGLPEHQDSPSILCTDCQQKLLPFSKRAIELTRKYHTEIQQLKSDWLRRCKNIPGEILRLGRRLAEEAHDGQFRRDGITPYIVHPEDVARRLKKEYPTEVSLITAGWLHDVIEDSEITAAQLRESGLPERVVQLVELLTKRKGEDYTDYIKRLAVDSDAVKIKIQDIQSNLADKPSTNQRQRYEQALIYLATIS